MLTYLETDLARSRSGELPRHTSRLLPASRIALDARRSGRGSRPVVPELDHSLLAPQARRAFPHSAAASGRIGWTVG